MPNHTYAQGRTSPTIIKDHWLDWYPEIRRLHTLKEGKLFSNIADGNAFMKDDIYVSVMILLYFLQPIELTEY